MMYWIEFEEACDVCGIFRGGHHHMTGEEGCCQANTSRRRNTIILPVEAKNEEEALKIANRDGMSSFRSHFIASIDDPFIADYYKADWMNLATSNNVPSDGQLHGFQASIFCAVGAEFSNPYYARQILEHAPSVVIDGVKDEIAAMYASAWEGIGKE